MPAPRFKHRPLSCIVVHIIRSCGFILLMPFTIIAYFAVVCLFIFAIPFLWVFCFISMLSSITNISTLVASIVSFTFGWKYWKNHCYKIEDESRYTKFLIMSLTLPVFYLITVLLANFFIHWDLNLSFGYVQSDFSFVLVITISLLLYGILRKMDFLFIFLFKWLYGELNDFRLPFILIEYPVTFIIYNQKKEINE